ncbi:hypothetical protein [Microbacterium caowuchunii]|uniref:Uncharacterized protein n=1 Tax=Microbacterium caowuchunii TaxID=2614638 RepID=A0A5N0T7Z5_9MICO|nr:hypothetical protein [Microbacterium caowuchunii]KAA9131165.1 hypothetical protein F6B40_12765 [Microbacterium caowuchunii]
MTPSPTPLPTAAEISINWDSFVPDLIVGLFTGLLVGLILAWTQSRAARKRERREIELRWEALRPRVGAQLLDPWDRRVMGPTLEEFASRTDALRELVEDVPLGSWAEVLDSEELRNLHELAKAATELHGAAPRFDGFLMVDIATYLAHPRGYGGPEYPSDFETAKLVRPYAVERLFASPMLSGHGGFFRDIRYESPVVQAMVDHPPVTYQEVLSMIERAEKYYGLCAVSIVDAQMTRFWYH